MDVTGVKEPVDALLMCGDKGASKAVCGENKTFLFVDGAPLFIHVLEALDKVSRVKRVFIIGARERLDHFLAIRCALREPIKPVITLQQGSSLLDNVWNGFLATLDGYEPGDEDKDPELKRRVIFALPGDAPLTTASEINEFFDKADMDKYDYVAGLAHERTMRQYHPTADMPGVKMSYIHLREGAYRINNMHMVRPFTCANRRAIQQMYASRYQKDLRNIVKLTRDMWANHVRLNSLGHYFLMQLSLFCAYIKLAPVSNLVRRFTPIRSVSKSVGLILGMRFGLVIVEQGRAALDIDNEKDYETIKAMFHEWKE